MLVQARNDGDVVGRGGRWRHWISQALPCCYVLFRAPGGFISKFFDSTATKAWHDDHDSLSL
jgi:hypothetical protein